MICQTIMTEINLIEKKVDGFVIYSAKRGGDNKPSFLPVIDPCVTNKLKLFNFSQQLAISVGNPAAA